MEQKMISDLRAGDGFEGFLLIKNFTVKTGSTGKNYVDLALADEKGEINGKIWNFNEAQFKGYKPHILVKVRGNVVEWNNSLQLRIEKIRLATDEDPVSINDFVPSAPKSPDDMFNVIISYIQRIRKTDLRDMVTYMVKERREKLMYYPAAQTFHHSVRGGLLYHITTMLAAADALAKVYTELDTDWLFAGVIVHDIEKTEEMAASDLGLVTDYTMKGLLLGHLVQGPLLVQEAGKAVCAAEETIILLQHMLLSHHYEPEYGSPKRPMFPEAEILHYLDTIDARMYDFRKALSEVEAGGFSDKQYVLDNRRVYKKKT